jgi:hypothetical protein
MIEDNGLMFASALAYNGTAEVIDLGGTRRGIGQPIKCFIAGHTLTAVSAVNIVDGTTSSPATTRVIWTCAAAALNAGPIEFYLPDNIQRYVTITLTGATTGGTWDCGIVDGVQTAR